MSGKHLGLRQKVFIQKMPSIKKKKIRSLLFPCTVFHSDKTSRLHAAQTKLSPKEHPEGTPCWNCLTVLCTVSNAPSQTAQTHSSKRARGPHRRNYSSCSRVPSPQQASQPSPKDPQVRRKKKKKQKNQNMTIKS